MREGPILFKGVMVTSIMNNLKNQTRRLSGLEDVNKNPDIWTFKKMARLDWMTKKSAKGKYGAYFETEQLAPRTIDICPQVCPYGGPGDRLWVKETFQLAEPWGSVGDEWIGDDLMEWDGPLPKEKPENLGYWWYVHYRADEPEMCRWWRPSIFMPRWASRILLEIVSVRVERLQAISWKDCLAEGIEEYPVYQKGIGTIGKGNSFFPKIVYKQLWDEINAASGFGWNYNPWVWVLSFKKVEESNHANENQNRMV